MEGQGKLWKPTGSFQLQGLVRGKQLSVVGETLGCVAYMSPLGNLQCAAPMTCPCGGGLSSGILTNWLGDL